MAKFVVKSLEDAGSGKMELVAHVEGLSEERRARVQMAFMLIQSASADGKWDLLEVLTCGAALKSALS